MAPVIGFFSFFQGKESEKEIEDSSEESDDVTVQEITMYYLLFLLGTFLVWLLAYFILRLISIRQKTRDPQRNQMYGGTRSRPSLTPATPPIYVSPSNLPPPPKYEFMAPPSYEEVVGVHPPSFAPDAGSSTGSQLPITQPITAAIASTGVAASTTTAPSYSETTETTPVTSQTTSVTVETTPVTTQTTPVSVETSTITVQTSPVNVASSPTNQTNEPVTSAEITTTLTITSETGRTEQTVTS